MEEYIYTDIIEISCPVGTFSVCHNNTKIPFSARKNSYNVPYYDITTETNYALDIDTDLLETNKQYNIVFSEGGCIFVVRMNIQNRLLIRLETGLSVLAHLI